MSRSSPALALLSCLLVPLAYPGCASNKDTVIDEESSSREPPRPFDDPAGGSAAGAGSSRAPRGEMLPSVDLAETAEENWNRGEKAFAEGEYQAAQRYYGHIRTKFPYSRFTALAELRLGDVMFARARFIEAIDNYQSFVRLHPNHEKLPYAMLRIGRAHYEQIPSDWFLLPPQEEKEQTIVRDAERALRDYVERYPNDEGAAEGQKLLVEVRKKLLAHERYVAGFYKRLGRDRAYVWRLEVIRREFSDVGVDDSLLFEIASVWARLGELDRARSAAKELTEKFPSSGRIREAEAIIGSSVTAPASAANSG